MPEPRPINLEARNFDPRYRWHPLYEQGIDRGYGVLDPMEMWKAMATGKVIKGIGGLLGKAISGNRIPGTTRFLTKEELKVLDDFPDLENPPVPPPAQKVQWTELPPDVPPRPANPRWHSTESMFDKAFWEFPKGGDLFQPYPAAQAKGLYSDIFGTIQGKKALEKLYDTTIQPLPKRLNDLERIRSMRWDIKNMVNDAHADRFIGPEEWEQYFPGSGF